MKVPLSVACWDYDRTRALFDGKVAIEGCDTNFLSLPVEETFFRALRSQEFDVAELSMSSYTMLRSRDISPYVAIPVFLSRMFRHSAIYVRRDSKIKTPQELAGKVVGLPEYQLTAPVWVRGLLEDEYGVKASSISWRTGGVEQAGRPEKVKFSAPDGVHVESIPLDQTLNNWLLEGKIDALIAPRAPSSYVRRTGEVIRLFSDFRTTEKAYYQKTGVFPIMHVVGIRKALVEQYPWLAASVFKAFLEAKDFALTELSEVGALKTSLPWLAAEYEETAGLMGTNFWSYGVDGNEKTLQTFLRYHHEQGLSARRMTPEDLFAPSTLEQTRI
jgi:4,5-dihydroxyphthalate decarboxylase